MTRIIKSIKGRLMLSYIILVTFSFILLGNILQNSIEEYYMDNIKERLLAEALIVKGFLGGGVFLDTEGLDRLTKEVAKDIETRITIVNIDGKVLGDSYEEAELMDNHRFRPEIKEAIDGRVIATSERYSATAGARMFYLALPIEEGGQLLGVVRLALPLSTIHEILNNMRKTINLSIFGITIAVILISIGIASSIIKPIEELSSTAEEIAKGNLSKKVFPRTSDEVGKLANSLNHMTHVLQEKINELEASKGKLEVILNNMSSGVLVFNSTGNLEMVNPAAIKLLDINDENLKEKQSFQIFRNYEFNSKIEEALNKQQYIKCEINLSYPDKKALEANLIPVIANNEMTALIVVMYDITELQAIAQMKTEFVGNASHELRTPLTSIKGFAETLLNGAMEDAATRGKFIKIIDSEADRLIRITDDLLNLSKAEAHKGTIEKKNININKIIKDTLLTINPKFIEKNIEVVLEIPDRKIMVKANEDALTMILNNLLDNAVKYTNKNGKMGIKLLSTKQNVILHVWDTGIGIPKQDLPRVFERFYRVDKARSRVLGGTGLGLAIVKHLIEAQGGEIWVESTLGKGTCFYISLPLD